MLHLCHIITVWRNILKINELDAHQSKVWREHLSYEHFLVAIANSMNTYGMKTVFLMNTNFLFCDYLNFLIFKRKISPRRNKILCTQINSILL